MTTNLPEQKIIMYSTTWCSDCHRAKWFFDNYGVDYEVIDIEKTAGAVDKVIALNNGNRSVPTIVFPDGSILVEPSTRELAVKVGVNL